MIEVRWAATTHVGVVRAVNQDSILSGPTIFAIADGMGGHAAGEVASSLAIATLSGLTGPFSEHALLEAVREADRRVIAEAAPGSGREGMGTTLVGLLVGNDADAGFLVLNVGDSRAYLFRDGELTQVSDDHSLVAELVREGYITPAEALVHPERNVITRVIGGLGDQPVDTWRLQAAVGDRFLLCSDGLTNELTDDTIANVLGANADPQSAVDLLLAQALAAGGRDNVSIVLVETVKVGERVRSIDEDTNPRASPPKSGSSPSIAKPDGPPPLITHVPSVGDGVALVTD